MTGYETRRRLALSAALATIAVVGAAFLPAPAPASFGIHDYSLRFTDPAGGPEALAGSHPDALHVSFEANVEKVGEKELPEEAIKDVEIFQPKGFVGDLTAVQRCQTLDFLTNGPDNDTACPDATAVGLIDNLVSEGKGAVAFTSPVYNLTPAPGTVARLGFAVSGVRVTIAVTISPTPPYRVRASTRNISQVLEFFGADVTLWGVPGDESHDEERGHCYLGGESCPLDGTPRPFFTLPRACEGPLDSDYELDSWQSPGVWVKGSGQVEGMVGCGDLGFAATTRATPSSSSAESSAGLEFTIEVEDQGLKNANEGARAQADIEAVKIAFPAGVTANPSAAEGLGTCSEARYESATVRSSGCPGASKLGTVEAQTPLLDSHPVHGSLYLAEQRANPFGSLLALYMVFRDEELGILIRQAVEVETDPATGRLIATTEEVPPFPLSRVSVRMRSGPRAPLVTPPECGTYETVATLYPSSGKAPLQDTSRFTIDSGPGGGACPAGELPFSPGFEAGSENNAAGSYSPFLMRLTRADGEQDMTRFSAVLAPGVSGRIAGVPWCPAAAIARAASREGRAELASPSCPAASRVGRIVTGAGVGAALTYVGGSLYLAGPYNGAPLSVAAIVPAVAGPFDVGTVVTRVGLRLNPKTGQVEVDGAASDPIPHILAGIPLKVREIRVIADRPQFTLNPTSCEESRTYATIFGGGSNFLSTADDAPFGAASRYQAASCASLAFKPRLALRLKGGVRRGAHPALRAVVTPRPGQANFSRAVVTLPRSAFLDQAHIRTICTRVQFAAGPGHGALCPKGARYGYARAWSPLLDEPAQGPVYLRSSDSKLPDLVVALKGPASAPVEVELSSRIDSVRGGIRSTFAAIPDLPVSRFVLNMQGGRKGLIVNSRHLCHKPKRNRANSKIRGQNGRVSKTRPRVVALTCAKRRKAKRSRAKRSAGHVSRASRAR